MESGSLTTGEWKSRSDMISFAAYRMIITRHYLEGSTKERSEKDQAQEVFEESEEYQGALPFTMDDLLSFTNDFPAKAHYLVRWYGLRDFLLVTPDMGDDTISSVDRQKLLLGSICTALRNTNCQLPIFVQMHHPREKIACGVMCAQGFHCYFNMVKLVHTPKGCDTLNGLLSLFKNKLCNSSLYTHLPVDVSIRFTYVLNDWTFFDEGSIRPDQLNIDQVMKFGDLPLGSAEEPISEFRLMVSWPQLAEDVVNDSIAHSDLVPANAPEWCVTVKYVSEPCCYLENYLGEFEAVLSKKESLDLVLRAIIRDEIDPGLANVMDRLAEPKVRVPDLAATIIPGDNKEKKRRLADDETIIKFMNYIFIPPVEDDTSMWSSNKGHIEFGDLRTAFRSQSAKKRSEAEEIARLKQRLTCLKTTSRNSFVWRLSLALAEAYHTCGGIEGLAQFWVKIVAELRHHFERGYVIASIEPGAPNLAMCLLHQKIQMLNCCIETRNAREGNVDYRDRSLIDSDEEQMYLREGQRNGVPSPHHPNRYQTSKLNKENSESSDSASDDDFYECSDSPTTTTTSSGTKDSRVDPTIHEEENKMERETNTEPSSPAELPTDDRSRVAADTNGNRNSVDNGQNKDGEAEESFVMAAETLSGAIPEGRLKPCGVLRLIGSDERMWVPRCQQSSPMTEDMLQEHADAILKLASSPECGRLTARFQSASLFSDMESFKAANPGCRLADFVRWFSPRDWTEPMRDENGVIVKEGELSNRMTLPGNMWQDLWQQAKPIPANRQRRLFDDTKEGEKILHGFLTMSPSDIAAAVLPCLIQAGLEKICENVHKGPRDMIPFTEQLIEQTKRELRMKQPNFKDLIRRMYEAETGIARAESLRQKLSKKDTSEDDVSGSSLKRFLTLKSQDSPTVSVEELIFDLLDKPEVQIEGGARGAVGVAITNLFENSRRAVMDDPTSSVSSSGVRSSRRLPPSQQFPTPIGKEFILRTKFPRPSSCSRQGAHRIYAVITGNEFRLAGAFTEDMLFF
ncbi:rab3 GTPase-activating protein catalytic subunit-like isoform X1 [Varroa destructor]|uniref:Rab3 GTPase-activating protein catalytic subunit n=2 Tax=Varroa destructor TaxID=109461 RepID=A0A7M7MF70_VARDE|nr:rab3 GTPase-activating protein catalytic subunit-like isoform X1 [Varroa destructor]XP_022672144.1 rab3 GTPase-activating protein catalytic subunit-like isoform X1 [Varroa destructor]